MGQLAKAILGTRHAWWLGAGASFAAGVPTVQPLRARILTALGLAGDDIALLEKKALPFEALFEVLLNSSDCASLLDVFRGTSPALAQLLVARLAEHGLLRTVVTTNFDTLVEDAFVDRRLQFDLYSTDEEFANIDWSDDRIRVIKLHGSLENRDELAVTIRRVAARHNAERRGQVIRELFEHESEGGVVIIGYSCSDHFDVSPAARLYSRNDRRILYVAHDPTTPASVAATPLHGVKPDNPFSGYDARSVTCVTDDLLRAMWQALVGEPPPTFSQPKMNWQESVDLWAESLSADGTSGNRKCVAGLLLKVGNLWKRSNEYLKAAIAEGLEEEVSIRALLAVGNNYRDLGEYELARRTLSEAESKSRDYGHAELQARVLNSLGIVAADVGDLDHAIDLYERALALHMEDRELEGKCHGNLGIALKNRNADGDLDEALWHHRLAYEIAQDIGDKRSEGRTLGNLGLIHTVRGELDISCKYYREARAVAESLGDLLHVAIWLHNEGEDTVIADPIKAKAALERSRDIFTDLGQQDFAKESCKVLAGIELRLSGREV